MMGQVDRKAIAIEFLQSASTGNRAVIERLVAAGARHHNSYFAAGMVAIFDAMVAAAKESPSREMDIKHVLADGDYVVVHSHIRQHPGDPGAAVVHIFRFEGDRIAEMWDIGQAVPVDNPNADGAF